MRDLARLVIYALVGAALALPSAARADAAADRLGCIAEALAMRAQGFARFQSAATDMLSAAEPALAPVARDAEAAQLAMHAEAVRRVLYVLEIRPELLDQPLTLDQAMNLDAAEEDLERLRAVDPDYAELEAAEEAAIARTRGTPGMAALRTLMRESVAPSAPFADAIGRLSQAQNAADAAFQACLR